MSSQPPASPRQPTTTGSRFERAVFYAGLALVLFGAGIAVDRYRLPPTGILDAAFDAVRDWRENWRHYLGIRSKWTVTATRPAGVTRHDPAAAFAGYTYVSAFRDGQFRALLVDMDGNVVHEWPFTYETLWRAAGFDEAPFFEGDMAIHGSRLLADGDVLINLNSVGVVRLGPCGEVRFGRAFEAHHGSEPGEDGRWIVPGRIRRHEAHEVAWMLRPSELGYFWDDTIATLGADGSWQGEVSIPEILHNSRAVYLFAAGPGSAEHIREDDPFHTNDVEPLPAGIADAFPLFEAGDLMLSLHHTDTIAIVDGETFELKWWRVGPWHGQHDPDFLPDGTIAVFDNRLIGSRPRFGQSRVLVYDPVEHRIVWQYEGTEADPFQTQLGGKVQQLPNGNFLVVSPQEGRVFEVTREEEPRVVWEWINGTGDDTAGFVFDGQRVGPGEAAAVLEASCS